MKKRILSFVSLLLCLILSLSMLVSCDNTSTNVSDEASNPETSTETSSDVSGDGEKVYVADIPNKKYDGETFYIHTAFYERGAAGYTLFGNYNDSEYESNVVNDAVENRNYAVEELLDIKIVEKCVESGRTTSGNDHLTLDTVMNAGSETYHMFCPNMYSAASFSMQSRLVNLLDEEYLHDLSEPWWDSFFVKDVAINDRLDFVTGDMTLYARNGLFVTLFNKDIVNNYGIPNLYDLVREKKWTIDKVYEYSKMMLEELDGNGIYNYNDKYGFGGQADTMTFWFYSFGGRIVSANSEGELVNSLYNETNVEFVNKIREFMLDDIYVNANDYFNDPGYKNTPTELLFEAFANDRSMFLNADLVFFKDVGEMKSDFGVLPSPLFEEGIGEYTQALNCWNTNPVCIADYISDEDIEFATIVMEALGAASKNIVTPAFVETTLKNQKTRDDDSIEMLDIILNNVGADIAHVYNWDSMGWMLNKLISDTTLEFSSFAQSYEGALNKAVNDLIEAYQE